MSAIERFHCIFNLIASKNNDTEGTLKVFVEETLLNLNTFQLTTFQGVIYFKIENE